MNFTCDVPDFREAFSLAALTLDKSKHASMTKLLLMQATKSREKQRVLLFSTDSMACCLVSVPANVDEVGNALVEPKEMGKSLPTLDDKAKLKFETKNDKLQFSCGNFKPRCSTGDPKILEALLKDLPLKAKPDLEIPAWKLREVLERTMMFASKTENTAAVQPFLLNVFLRTNNGYLEAHATNVDVLAKATIKLDGEVPNLKIDIPARAVPALQKILSNPRFKTNEAEKAPTIRLILEKDAAGVQKRLFVRTDAILYGTNLSSVSIPAKALDTEAGVGKAVVATVELNRQEFIDVIRRCEPFLQAYEQARALRMRLSGNVVTFFDRDEEELDQLQGTGVGSGEARGTVNLLYAASVLNASKEEIVTLRFIKTSNAVLLGSGSDEKGRGFYVVGCMKESAKKAEPAAVAA